MQQILEICRQQKTNKTRSHVETRVFIFTDFRLHLQGGQSSIESLPELQRRKFSAPVDCFPRFANRGVG